MKATTVDDPAHELKAVLADYLPWHGARTGFLVQCLVVLFKVRSVRLAEFATGFDGSAKVKLRYKRQALAGLLPLARARPGLLSKVFSR